MITFAKTLNFIEIWIFPNNIGKKPIFDKQTQSIECYENKIYPIFKSNANLLDKEDYSIYISKITNQKEVTYFNSSERLVYLYLKEGKLTINNSDEIDSMDSAKITIRPNKSSIIKNNFHRPALVILVDIPKDN